MPTISNFYRMFFDDPAPPHFHAEYGEYKAQLTIDTLEILDEWAVIHRNELRADWELCANKQQPKKILPLE